MLKIEFYDLENMDGYFSGIIFIQTIKERYILEFGYDIEFSQLKLLNCNNNLYNTEHVMYSQEKILEIREDYAGYIINEIKYRLR